ncbi:MAG: heavy-metal-associated domain-containing protein [bacterium]|nr:heavy-metal-associated domain-containing protein [bacterium]
MTTQFKITNMSCASCAKINENSLLKTRGVASAKVDYPSGQTTVVFDEKTVGEKHIKDIVTKNGYGVI